MARAASLTDPAIGRRIAQARRLRGWSVRAAAGYAGIDHRTWGRYEDGRISADNRVTLGKIAQALGRSTSELLGQPTEPTTRREAATRAQVTAATVAFIGADLRVPAPGPAPALQPLLAQLELVCDLRRRCAYDQAAARLPELVTGLHAAATAPTTGGPAGTAAGVGADAGLRAGALRALVLAADAGSFTIRYAGDAPAAWVVAERGRQAAEHAGDPVLLGVGGYQLAHAATGCGLYERALGIAGAAAAEVHPALGHPDTGVAAEAAAVYGQLILTQAFAWHALGRVDEAVAAVTDADALAAQLADRLSEDQLRAGGPLGLGFSPTNVRFWQVAMWADSDDPHRAVALAADTHAELVASISRRFAFLSDTARAITHAYPDGRRDEQALRLLLAAECLAPQRMTAPLVIETVRGLIERGQRARGLDRLRGLADRIGIPL